MLSLPRLNLGSACRHFTPLLEYEQVLPPSYIIICTSNPEAANPRVGRLRCWVTGARLMIEAGTEIGRGVQ